MKGYKKQSFTLVLTSLIMLVALMGGTWSTVFASGIQPAPDAAKAALVIPTFDITSVQTDSTVTIKTHNFPANDSFKVLMNFIGTHGSGGIQVATVDSGAGGSFTQTFNIPTELKGQKQIAIRLESSASGYFAYNWFWNNTSTGSTIPVTGGTLPSGVIPTISITSVDVDNAVTIQTHNYPANDTFNVTMGKMGTRGVGGVSVGTFNSGTGGSAAATFNIPDSLKGLSQIAIRLESPTSGYFSFNWFWNSSSSGIPVTGGLPAGVFPTFSIVDVVSDTSVTVKTANLPANDTFDVLMNFIGTRGVGGTKVQTISTGTGGTQTLTFDIPASMKGQQRIAIRMESTASGYFAYNWFWNSTTTGGIPPTGGTPVPTVTPGLTPTIGITAVVADNTVTIKTANFPANDTFNVTMGAYGTKGVGGVSAGTFESGSGGTQTATFNIPDAMKGASRIAIRLESPTSGYFSFNWFWNNTYP